MSDYTPKERQALLAKFHYMDLNGDGVLSIKEIEECIKHSKLPKERAKEFLSLFDSDGDGTVTLEEYERALGLKEIPQTTVADWEATFRELDVDNSGELTVEEVYEGVKKLGVICSMSDIKDLIASVDSDGDGSLNMQEFVTLMRIQ
uniref:EF-hand domain-containing protein n=1 Tax=Schistocephalus solidus TaxID=70667 RepID=A0A0X3PNS9_SCHSO